MRGRLDAAGLSQPRALAPRLIPKITLLSSAFWSLKFVKNGLECEMNTWRTHWSWLLRWTEVNGNWSFQDHDEAPRWAKASLPKFQKSLEWMTKDNTLSNHTLRTDFKLSPGTVNVVHNSNVAASMESVGHLSKRKNIRDMSLTETRGSHFNWNIDQKRAASVLDLNSILQ